MKIDKSFFERGYVFSIISILVLIASLKITSYEGVISWYLSIFILIFYFWYSIFYAGYTESFNTINRPARILINWINIMSIFIHFAKNDEGIIFAIISLIIAIVAFLAFISGIISDIGGIIELCKGDKKKNSFLNDDGENYR